MNIKDGDQILNEDEPFNIFDKDSDIDKQFRTYAKMWHPDFNKTNPKASDVFNHIIELKNIAKDRIAKGSWISKNEMRIYGEDHTEYRIKFKKSHPFELGTMYISDSIIAYIIDSKYNNFYNNFVNQVSNLRYSSDKMKNEMNRFFPNIIKTIATDDDKLIIIVRKTDDQFLLKDVINYFGDKIDPRHVAWMISSLYNLCCYFEYKNISHLGISIDTCFVSMKYHSVSLLGGWWYTVNTGEKMIGIASKDFSSLPKDVQTSKMSSRSCDLELLRAVGREALGDKHGMKLRINKDIPTPMSNWLIYPSKENAIKEYGIWYDKVLIDSYGKPKFIKCEISSDELYR